MHAPWAAMFLAALGEAILVANAAGQAPPVAAAPARPSQPIRALDLKPIVPTPLPPDQQRHPLAPVLEWAEQALPAIESIRDYSATLVKQERVDGQLRSPGVAFIKIRQHPFSVYLRSGPKADPQRQEAIYVQGQNHDDILAHDGTLGPLKLDPEGRVAMRGRRYPITAIGIANLVRRLIEVARKDLQHDECLVRYYPGAKLNGRPCTLVEVEHPQPRPYFTYHLARIYVDDALKLPVRFESYDWPDQAGGQPLLMEEYTYLDLRLNQGFTDEDFSIRNPQYHYPASSPGPPAQ